MLGAGCRVQGAGCRLPTQPDAPVTNTTVSLLGERFWVWGGGCMM